MKMFLNKSAYADNNLSVKNENINGAIVKVNDKYSSKNGVSPILGYCLIIIKFCSIRGYPGFPDILGLFFISQHFGFHIFLLPIYT